MFRSLSQGLVLALLSLRLLSAQDFKITSGVVDKQVLQRRADERTDLQLGGIAGKTATNKFIEVRVTSKGNPVTGFDWTPNTSRVKNGRWTADIKGLPTGGPYRIEARVNGTSGVAAVEDVLVGDLWILAGQSNMEGVGDLVDVQPPQELVHSFDQMDQWDIAKEPLHNMLGSVDAIHWQRRKKTERLTGDKLAEYTASRKKGAGLGLPFAVEVMRRTGVPIGLVPCADGGTSMDEWSPSLKDKGGESLYGATVRRLKAVGGKIKGVLWYQGESDASPELSQLFLDKFVGFVKAIRSDAGDEKLPFYYVQIGRHVSNGNAIGWNRVQDSQRRAEALIPSSGMAVAVDLQLDDPIHVGTQDHKRLAHRLADLVTHDLFPAAKDWAQIKRGPRPVSAKVDGGAIRVTFAEVNGRLQAEGRLSGFSLHAANGDYLPVIYRQRFDPADPNVVLLDLQDGKLPEKSELWYGWGRDPYCNLRDTADMAAPAFGPFPIQ